MADYIHLWFGALFLKREAYEYQRDRKDSFAHGLLFIVLAGIVVALFGIAGAFLRFATSPSADAVKNTVLTYLQSMPWYTQFIQSAPQAEQQFLSGYSQFWAVAGSSLMGYPSSSGDWAWLLASVLTTPLLLIIGWLVYGVLAHLIAGQNNPHAGLGHGLGTLALATSPQLLNIITIVPHAGLTGGIVGLWTVILNVFALRTAYRISTRRAIGAALFPLLLLFIVLLLLGCLAYFILVVALRSVGA